MLHGRVLEVPRMLTQHRLGRASMQTFDRFLNESSLPEFFPTPRSTHDTPLQHLVVHRQRKAGDATTQPQNISRRTRPQESARAAAPFAGNPLHPRSATGSVIHEHPDGESLSDGFADNVARLWTRSVNEINRNADDVVLLHPRSTVSNGIETQGPDDFAPKGIEPDSGCAGVDQKRSHIDPLYGVVAGGVRVRHSDLGWVQNVDVLRDVHFELGIGELTCLKGDVATGKSTLLNLMAGKYARFYPIPIPCASRFYP